MSILLETVTGRLVDIENPEPSMICIEDIAWSLSRIPRFCGHTITTVAYNIAQHSIFVADEVAFNLLGGPAVPHLENANHTILKALLHDAAEAYTGDLPSPLKNIPAIRNAFKEIEDRLTDVIFEALGLSPYSEQEEKIIKDADRRARKIEAHAFMPSRGKNWPGLPEISLEDLQGFNAPLDSLVSYKLFMEKYMEYR